MGSLFSSTFILIILRPYINYTNNYTPKAPLWANIQLRPLRFNISYNNSNIFLSITILIFKYLVLSVSAFSMHKNPVPSFFQRFNYWTFSLRSVINILRVRFFWNDRLPLNGIFEDRKANSEDETIRPLRRRELLPIVIPRK